MQAYLFNGHDSIQGNDSHPLSGFGCVIVERFASHGKDGYNARVAVLAPVDVVADAMSMTVHELRDVYDIERATVHGVERVVFYVDTDTELVEAY